MTCQTEAKVLARSMGYRTSKLTSFQLRYPLQIHAELMTHRMFSRNARSSRAVPTARMIEEVKASPFIPRYWGANQKGMQAGAEHNELVDLGGDWMLNEEGWLWARDRMVEAAGAFAEAGYHKQIANRLLAPFLHIDVVLTTTDLSNWEALRIDPAAEPHIRDLALAMRAAVEQWDANQGGPLPLRKDEWHLPYYGVADEGPMTKYLWDLLGNSGYNHENMILISRAMSVTRCAQVSYVPFHEAKLTVAQEIERHDALISARPMHASPAEHQATPDWQLPDGSWANPGLGGNLGPGWIQYRKTLAGEHVV